MSAKQAESTEVVMPPSPSEPAESPVMVTPPPNAAEPPTASANMEPSPSELERLRDILYGGQPVSQTSVWSNWKCAWRPFAAISPIRRMKK
jgi:hypothetical protein